MQFSAHEIHGCLPIVKMRSVGHHCLNRNVVREDFVIRIQDRAAFSVDDLLVNVLFSGKTGVFVVFDCLQIDQTKRKNAEQPDKSAAHEYAAGPTVYIHFVPEGLATGWTTSSSAERGGMVSRTMLASEIGIIFK